MQNLLISFVLFGVCLCLLWIFLDRESSLIRISMESCAPCSKFGLQNPLRLQLVSCHLPWLEQPLDPWGPKQAGVWAGDIPRDLGSPTSLSPLLNTTCSDGISAFWLQKLDCQKSEVLDKAQPWMWQFTFCLLIFCLCLKSISLDIAHFQSLCPDKAYSEK